jgi:arginyl-tRNA synthetase
MSGPVTTSSGGGSVPSLQREMVGLFKAAIDAAFPGVGEQPIVNPCGNAKFGDYQCNNAMPLHGKLKGTEGAPKAPRDIANKIVAALPANALVAETSLAGPGFINVKLSSDYLADRLLSMLRRCAVAGAEGCGCRLLPGQGLVLCTLRTHGGAGDGRSTHPPPALPGCDVCSGSVACWAPTLGVNRVVVDFSSPNVAKEMHVGHLRSTIIGDTLCRALEYCGCDVVRLAALPGTPAHLALHATHMPASTHSHLPVIVQLAAAVPSAWP